MSSGRSPTGWAVLVADLVRLLGDAAPGWLREDSLKAARRFATLAARDALAAVDQAPTRDTAAEELGVARRTLFRAILPRLRPPAE